MDRENWAAAGSNQRLAHAARDSAQTLKSVRSLHRRLDRYKRRGKNWSPKPSGPRNPKQNQLAHYNSREQTIEQKEKLWLDQMPASNPRQGENRWAKTGGKWKNHRRSWSKKQKTSEENCSRRPERQLDLCLTRSRRKMKTNHGRESWKSSGQQKKSSAWTWYNQRRKSDRRHDQRRHGPKTRHEHR
jgi:hypothetical protein